MAKPASTPLDFSVADLANWNLLAAFQQRLEPILAAAPKTETELDPRRKLFPAQYFSMTLFALINPAIKTARALCGASHMERMQAEVCGEPVSLGSFSDMQSVADPELLAGLLRSLTEEALPVYGDKRLRAQVSELIAIDGTLLPALPRMAWALFQNPQNRAGKLHLEFSVWRQMPVEFTITDGNASERAAWKKNLKKGVCYVNDRAYSHDFKLIKEVAAAGANFVLRLNNNTVLTPLAEARALSPADRAAGVVEDVQVRLGSDADGPVGRLVRVEADGHTFLLFTNLENLESELVGLIYRYRWQIELFFKWIKCILGCRHWLAESQEGMTIQVYCALIASVLIALWTGRKPSKRQWEALQLYWMGWATLEELLKVFGPKKTQ